MWIQTGRGEIDAVWTRLPCGKYADVPKSRDYTGKSHCVYIAQRIFGTNMFIALALIVQHLLTIYWSADCVLKERSLPSIVWSLAGGVIQPRGGVSPGGLRA
jgi:hypothetical protein